MNDQRAMIEFNQQIFSAPTDSPYPPAAQAARQIRRKRPTQAATAQRDCGNDLALQVWRETAPGDFNFWQFWHMTFPPPLRMALRLGVKSTDCTISRDASLEKRCCHCN